MSFDNYSENYTDLNKSDEQENETQETVQEEPKKYTSVFDSQTESAVQASDLPTKPAIIKVLGIGGAGNNAINRMITAGVKSADFIAVNTDNQALIMSEAKEKIQIGKAITNGKGAGAMPIIGEQAALESQEELMKVIKNTDLIFITAGMGGGTGTGAAPVIAKMAKDMGILTVAVVTKPFGFEGYKRMKNAEEGISKLRNCVDTLLVIPNEKLWDVAGGNISLLDAFGIADDVLRQGIQGISDLIVIPSLINLDFADVCTIMRDKGYAHMGIGKGTGKNKTIDAVMNAISSPLLETHIEGATGVLIYINGGTDVQLGEVQDACNMVREAVSPEANIIVGFGADKQLEGTVMVTVIATGFEDPTASSSEKPKEAVGENGNQQPQGVHSVNQYVNQFAAQRQQNVQGVGNFQSQNVQIDTTPNTQQNGNNDNGVHSSRIAFDDSDIPPFLRKMKK